jgi:hypothetical protein
MCNKDSNKDVAALLSGVCYILNESFIYAITRVVRLFWVWSQKNTLTITNLITLRETRTTRNLLQKHPYSM